MPIGKEVISKCDNCQASIEEKKMPQDIKQIAQLHRANLRAPWYTFIGLIIAIVVAGSNILYHTLK